jgi:hypothetical protein
MKYTDTQACIMLPSQIRFCFEEFFVNISEYRDDFDALLAEIECKDSDGEMEVFRARHLAGEGLGSGLSYGSQIHTDTRYLDTRKFMRLLNVYRRPWTHIHTRLCERMAKMMTILGAEKFVDSDLKDDKKGSVNGNVPTSKKMFLRSPRGVESAASRFLIAQLDMFADTRPADPTECFMAFTANQQNHCSTGDDDDDDNDDGNVGFHIRGSSALVDKLHRKVDTLVFQKVLKSSGLLLSHDDTTLLADATDDHPSAGSVVCDVLLDALGARVDNPTARSGQRTHHRSDQREGHGADAEDDDDDDDDDDDREEEEKLRKYLPASLSAITDAGISALQHLRDCIWIAGARQKRSSVQWPSDLRALVRGFDTCGNGYVTTEDFSMALELIGVTLPVDVMKAIPVIPDGPGLVAYPAILAIILRPPTETGTGIDARLMDGRGLEDQVDEDDDDGDDYAGDGYDTKEGVGIPRAVRELVHMVRRSSQQSLPRKHTASYYTAPRLIERDSAERDAVYNHLTKAFKHFDPNVTNRVSVRHFCLGVSVIMNNDDGVLSRADWRDIIDYFDPHDRSTYMHSQHILSPRGRVSEEVDYSRFCAMVAEGVGMQHAR